MKRLLLPLGYSLMTGQKCVYYYNYFIINITIIIIIRYSITRKAITDHHHIHAVHQYLTRLKLIDVVASRQSSKMA